MNEYLHLVETFTHTDAFFLGLRDFIIWSRWLLVLAVALTIADLVFGIKAAKFRGEVIRRSRALKRTLNKGCSYILWIVVAYSFGEAFGKPFGIDLIPLIMLITIYGIELESALSNYLEPKGKKVKLDIGKLFGKSDSIKIENK